MSLTDGFVRRARGVHPGAAVLLAVALALPSVVVGFALDDHLGRVLARGRLPGVSHASWDLFRLVGDEAMRAHMVREGWLPWWTGSELRVAFLRPLASLGHALDYGVWPAWAGHLHTLPWLGAMVAAAAWAYRELGKTAGASAGFAAVATLLFALDDGHTAAAGWIASRNAIAAPALVLASLALHVRSRRGGGLRDVGLGVGALAASLGFGETAYAGLGYFVAFSLLVDRGPRRLLGVVPHLLVCVGWMGGAAALGYGAAGSGLYVSPLSDPLRFVESVATRLPVTLSSVVLLPPSDLWSHFSPSGQVELAVICAAIAAVVIGAMLRLLRGDRLALCLAAGSVLSCVVVSATFPADRMLALAGFGGLGLIARTLDALTDRPRGRLASAFGGLLVVVHGALGLVAAPLRSLSTWPMALGSELAVATALARPAGGVVVLAAPDPFCSSLRWYLASLRDATPWVQCLVATAAPVRVHRLGERVLTIAPLGGFQPTPMDALTRSHGERWNAGDRVEVAGMTVRIAEIGPTGRPVVADFSFAAPLERLRFVAWSVEGYVDVGLPPVGGETVVTPRF